MARVPWLVLGKLENGEAFEEIPTVQFQIKSSFTIKNQNLLIKSSNSHWAKLANLY